MLKWADGADLQAEHRVFGAASKTGMIRIRLTRLCSVRGRENFTTFMCDQREFPINGIKAQ